jgi:hypothetical protein
MIEKDSFRRMAGDRIDKKDFPIHVEMALHSTVPGEE